MRKADSMVMVALLAFAAACGDDGSNSASGGGGSDPSGAGTPGSGGSPPAGCAGGPLASPIPGCAPAPLASTGDPHQDCVDRINQLRAECQCLPPLARWTEAEGCTDGQSSDDQGSGPHANFGACGESAQNSCPDWPSTDNIVAGCLQGMWDEGPGEPFAEHGHYINMSNQGYSKVACGFATGNEGVYSNQNFAP